jgi:hypothetical protein
MTAGYSGTPLGRKLGIKPGHLVAFSGGAVPGSDEPPHKRVADGVAAEVGASVCVRTDLRARGPYDVIVVFVRSEGELRRRFEQARARLAMAGGLWVAWPKQKSPLATKLKEGHVRTYGLSTGLVDNKVCAIDDDWSGLRFVVRTKDRP